MKYHVPLTRGHLELNNPFRLLASGALRQVSGTLTFSRHRCVKQIYLRKGAIVGASSNQPSESLGNILLCNGIITTEAYTQSLNLMDNSDKRHGEILITLGALEASKLPAMLRLQHLTRLVDAVSWPRGLYEFRECEAPQTNETFSLLLIFQSALFRRLGREKIVASARQHRGAIVRHRPSIVEPLLGGEEELAQILSNIDNQRTVAQLATGHRNQMLFYTNMLLLRELGAIEFKKPATAKRAA